MDTYVAGQKLSKEYIRLGGRVIAIENRGVSPTGQHFGNSGGSDKFSVTLGESWTAASNDPFIHVNTPSGSGIGLVNYTVDGNSGDARTGTISIAEFTFTVNQDGGTGCGSGSGSQPNPVSPTYLEFESAGAAQTVALTTCTDLAANAHLVPQLMS